MGWLWYFSANLFFRSVSVKKRADFAEIFLNRFDIPHYPLRFFTLTPFLWERQCTVNLLIAQLLLHCVFWTERKFLVVETFPLEVFSETNRKPNVFQRTDVILSQFFDRISQVVRRIGDWTMGYEALVAFNFQAEVFQFLHKGLAQNCVEKLFQQNVAFSRV